ncbi:MAG: AbrB family transcriptional regulator [Tabrizicola sp.]|uniref:AbrB family transcriptional regulator n=1 Tax=Tabrizicola sp. TaxID=2005166 RepID=UPI002ABCC161|nr:AbrB family transcriptional regulator [Tabrizicola sp.]MDZ4086773.1 AbrB family transcriptional regulator [Tabrizicola sp.]
MPTLARIAAGLALGTLGGVVFHALALPLPWMLGALFVTMTASVAGLPVQGPARLRPAIVAIIGVLLGSRFTPDVMGQVGEMLVTLAILLVYLVVVAIVVVPFYRYVGRQDWTTAYFAGMPGGLSEMIEFGEARGANVPAIVLAHSLRIVVTIALMAFLFRVVLGHDVGAAAMAPGPALGLADAAILIASAVLGAFLGTRLGLPAPTFLGPLILSAAVHLAGFTESAPPPLLVNAAQVVLGTILGCRFLGIAPVMLARAGLLSLGSTILTLALAGAAGLAMGRAAGVGLDQALLALAPGGLTEMGLIALAIHADVAFVALHHVARILVVLVLAPLAVRFLPDDR